MSEPWTTSDEKQWINNLGRHDQSIKKPSYITLLGRYLEAAKKRKNWDRIDKRAVVDYAKNQLLKAKKQDGISNEITGCR